MTALPIRRIVLYKHGVGHFEREGVVEGDASLTLTFKQAEVSDVLKSLTVIDEGGGRISSVSYDSTKPLQQLLAEVALSIPDMGSLVGLLPQLKGARVSLHTGVGDPVEGVLLGLDTTERQTGDGVVKVVLVSVVTDAGAVRSLDLHQLASLQLEDARLRQDLDYYLRTLLSSKKKDARTFTFFAQGGGQRTIRLSYTVAAPVWKATYRILLGEESAPALIQGWAVVDNTQDEDWENVELALIAGLPVSFTHDLYTPRYIRRPRVEVKETTGVLPPQMEEGIPAEALAAGPDFGVADASDEAAGTVPARRGRQLGKSYRSTEPLEDVFMGISASAVSSTPAQVREREIGDLLEYRIEHSVTIRRNQSALVPILLKPFAGQPVLLYNKNNRAQNPMSCVLFRNTTGLTLEGGPVTVLQTSSYVGEAMLDTLKPNEERLVAYAVELSVSVLDNLDTRDDEVHRVVVRHGILTTFRRRIQQVAYTFNNKGERTHELYLEHPRPGEEWELFDTPGLHETTKTYWRFRLSLPAKQTTQFVVRQRRSWSSDYQLPGLTAHNLGFWVQQNYLDAATEKALREVVRLREEATRQEEIVHQLEQERQAIHSEQQRIRDNLQALGDRPSEKELRERFVRTFNAQEDRLEVMQREQKEATAARDRCQEQIAALLAKLEYEAVV